MISQVLNSSPMSRVMSEQQNPVKKAGRWTADMPPKRALWWVCGNLMRERLQLMVLELLSTRWLRLHCLLSALRNHLKRKVSSMWCLRLCPQSRTMPVQCRRFMMVLWMMKGSINALTAVNHSSIEEVCGGTWKAQTITVDLFGISVMCVTDSFRRNRLWRLTTSWHILSLNSRSSRSRASIAISDSLKSPICDVTCKHTERLSNQEEGFRVFCVRSSWLRQLH